MMIKKFRDMIQRDILLYVVFVTGAVVLAVEVMAVRILAPYFGNTIYTFSSVLSVILAALSVGYWHGGKMADKNHSIHAFFQIVAKAGWAVIIMQFLSTLVLVFFSATFSIVSGPIIASLILFFYPSYLFGLLSPYVIKLRSDTYPERGIGTISGEVFFASTIGSIVGSLLSGFVLVPIVGITTSLFIAGGITVCIGTIGTFLQKKENATDKEKVIAKSIFILIIVGIIILILSKVTTQNILASTFPNSEIHELRDGVYERIAVVDTNQYKDLSGRVLVLDRTFSSGVTLPEGNLLFPYTKYYRLYRAFSDNPQNVLVLGAGTGTYAKAIHEDLPNAQIDIVDVEPKLFEYASKYFFIPITTQITPHVADGRQFLRTTNEQYDFVLGDMYSQMHAVPWHVSTKEYYETLYERMSDGGVYMANHIGGMQDEVPSLIWSSVRTPGEIFGDVAVFAVTSSETNDVQNFILVARKNASLEPLEKLSLSKNKSLTEFASHLVSYDASILEKHAVYTDNLAPLELYAARMSANR